MNITRSKLLGSVLALVVAFGGVGFAGATLTMDATSITGSGNVTLNGITTSNYAIGAATTSGTITIGGTAQAGAISIGNVSTLPAVNLGGTVYVNSATAGAVGISTSTGEVSALQVNLKSDTDATDDTMSLLGAYIGVSNTASGTNMIHRQLQGILSSVTMNENAFAAYGVQGHVSVKAGAVSPNSGYIVGLSGKVTLADNVATGAIAAGLFTLDSTAGMRTPANANGISVNVVNTTVSSIIDATTNDGGAATNGLNLRGAMTTGINLSGATIAGEGIILPTQAKDATCTAGGIIYDGTNFWGCTATNTYTKLDN